MLFEAVLSINKSRRIRSGALFMLPIIVIDGFLVSNTLILIAKLDSLSYESLLRNSLDIRTILYFPLKTFALQWQPIYNLDLRHNVQFFLNRS